MVTVVGGGLRWPIKTLLDRTEIVEFNGTMNSTIISFTMPAEEWKAALHQKIIEMIPPGFEIDSIVLHGTGDDSEMQVSLRKK